MDDVRGIKLPGEDRLPPGPARDLVVSLHALYRGAGLPGLRRIARAVTDGDFPDVVSHETVSDMLNGKSVPRWSKLNCVVRQLAMWNTPPLDPDQTAVRFLSLWQAAEGIGLEESRHRMHVGDPADVIQPDSGTGTQDPDVSASPTASLGFGSPAWSTQPATHDVITGRLPAEYRAADALWTETRQCLVAGPSRWREPDGDSQTAQVRHLRENQCSHPSFSAQGSLPHSPPAVRLGIGIACNPLDGTQPTSSAIRASFLSFLGRQPLAGLVRELTALSPDAIWTKWGGHGRSNHEAILTNADQQTAPVAWARLLLPEPRMREGWRDSHLALLVLHIERRPWETDGPLAPPIPFLNWHAYFTKALESPGALASFLIQDLGLEIPVSNPDVLGAIAGTNEHSVASIVMWLDTPQAMTDLVDIKGFQQLPGSPVSSQFAAYAVAHASGEVAADMAIEWMQQISDYTLHLDGHDSALLGLRE